VRLITLGCGWAGVLVAGRWGGLCIDKDVEVGGLLKSVAVDGFTIDVGGTHVIFSRDREVLGEMLDLLGGNVWAVERRAFVLLGGLFVPYPLENGLYVLPPEERAEALVSFLEVYMSMGEGWRPRSFEEWVRAFGKWIAEKYLIPYNEKIWKRPLSEIDVDWVYTPGRLPVPDWRAVAKAAAGVPTVGYVENAKFYYPLRGGIQALYNAARKRAEERGARFVQGEPVESVVVKGGVVVVNGKYNAERVVSTIPLPELIEALEPNDELKEYATRFDYNSVAVVAVAVGKEAPDVHWVYVPDRDVVFHRYVWLSNYSPYNAPRGKSLLLAEVTLPPGQAAGEWLVDRVVRGLARLGVVEEKDVLFAKAWFHKYGYPIHRIGTAPAREFVIRRLAQMGIATVGRWGTWKYLNMDMVLKQVKEMTL